MTPDSNVSPPPRPRAEVFDHRGHPVDHDPAPCLDGAQAHEGDDFDVRGIPGTLWQREADRAKRHVVEDVTTSESRRQWGPGTPARMMQPAWLRAWLDKGVTLRRPAMRERRS